MIDGRGISGSLEPSRLERDGEDLESKRDQDLVANLVRDCEGDAANKATMIDYSKTGANKR